MKRLKQHRQSFLGSCRCRCRDLETYRRHAVATADAVRDGAGRPRPSRELDGVADEVEQDLLQALSVGDAPRCRDQDRRPGRAQALCDRRCPERARSLTRPSIPNDTGAYGQSAACRPRSWSDRAHRSGSPSATSPTMRPFSPARAAGRSRPECRSRSSAPRTPFIGVRISWLMVARNCDFARLAASAASLDALQQHIRRVRLLAVLYPPHGGCLQLLRSAEHGHTEDHRERRPAETIATGSKARLTKIKHRKLHASEDSE